MLRRIVIISKKYQNVCNLKDIPFLPSDVDYGNSDEFGRIPSESSDGCLLVLSDAGNSSAARPEYIYYKVKYTSPLLDRPYAVLFKRVH